MLLLFKLLIGFLSILHNESFFSQKQKHYLNKTTINKQNQVSQTFHFINFFQFGDPFCIIVIILLVQLLVHLQHGSEFQEKQQIETFRDSTRSSPFSFVHIAFEVCLVNLSFRFWKQRVIASMVHNFFKMCQKLYSAIRRIENDG